MSAAPRRLVTFRTFIDGKLVSERTEERAIYRDARGEFVRVCEGRRSVEDGDVVVTRGRTLPGAAPVTVLLD